jgi:hypothetical protein
MLVGAADAVLSRVVHGCTATVELVHAAVDSVAAVAVVVDYHN